MDCTMNIGIGCGQIVFNQVAIINYMKIKTDATPQFSRNFYIKIS